MGKGHIAVNKYISDKTRFADFVNGIIFKGRQVVLPEQLEKVEGEYEILLEDKKGKTAGKTRYRDVIMRWKGEVDFCFFACENQSEIHYAMPVKDMLYDSLAYFEQIQELWKSHNEGKGQGLEPAEYLSHFRKEDKIYPIVTIVFYYGSKKWDGNKDLYSMFHLSGSMKEVLKEYIPNYWINVLDVNEIEDITRFKTDLQKILGMLKCRGNKEELVQYIRGNEPFFGNVDFNTQQAIAEFLQSKELMGKFVKRSHKEEKYNMCKALEEFYQDGVEQGRQEMRSALDEYYQDGVEQGRQEMRSALDEYYQDGVEQGRQEAKDESIKMLVEVSQEYGQTKEATNLKVMEKYQLTKEEAAKKTEQYWK